VPVFFRCCSYSLHRRRRLSGGPISALAPDSIFAWYFLSSHRRQHVSWRRSFSPQPTKHHPACVVRISILSRRANVLEFSVLFCICTSVRYCGGPCFYRCRGHLSSLAPVAVLFAAVVAEAPPATPLLFWPMHAAAAGPLRRPVTSRMRATCPISSVMDPGRIRMARLHVARDPDCAEPPRAPCCFCCC
jgi:hypothetical protein